jgi:hypothetical protein
MTLARRLGRLEDRALAEGLARLRAAWAAWCARPGGEERRRAFLAASGCADDSPASLAAWRAAQPAESAPLWAAMVALIDPGVTEARARRALAIVAPHLGLPATAPPLAILAAYRMRYTGDYRTTCAEM